MVLSPILALLEYHFGINRNQSFIPSVFFVFLRVPLRSFFNELAVHREMQIDHITGLGILGKFL